MTLLEEISIARDEHLLDLRRRLALAVQELAIIIDARKGQVFRDSLRVKIPGMPGGTRIAWAIENFELTMLNGERLLLTEDGLLIVTTRQKVSALKWRVRRNTSGWGPFRLIDIDKLQEPAASNYLDYIQDRKRKKSS